MDYFVIGEGGAEYGPANLDTLRKWAEEGRIHPTTRLKSFDSGVVVEAVTISDLFPRQAPPVVIPEPAATSPNPYANPPSPYPRGGQVPKPANTGNADVAWAFGRSALALVFAIMSPFPTAGLIVAGYGVYRGYRAQSAGHRMGTAALIVSVVTLVIVGGIAAFKTTHRDQFDPYRSGFGASAPGASTPSGGM